MQSLFFWKNWLTEYKWILYTTITVFAFSLLYMWFSYFTGTDSAIQWEKLQEQKIIESTIHTFKLGPFDLQVPGESFVIFEYFHGGVLQINPVTSYIYLAILMFSVAVMLSVITTLERFWFFAGMTLFILFVSSLKLEVVEVFSQRNNVPGIVVMIVFSGLAYCFKSFFPATRFIVRLASFIALIVVCGALVYYFSDVQYPMLHLAVTSYSPGILFTLLFVLMVAHEIFASFVYITSQGKKNGFRDFFTISVIWLANLVITYLHEIGSIQWNFIYINLFLMFTVSALLGFWGFRHRESLYSNIVSFHPFGAYFFLAIGAIAFSFIAHEFSNVNDVALETVRDIIIYSHLAFGIIFLIYFLSNFLGVAESNLSVHRVLYKPNRMPYFTFRLAGVILVISCIVYSNWRNFVYQGMAGFFNDMGDLYSLFDEGAYSEVYYTQASTYSFQGFHSNYVLAQRKSSELIFKDAHYRYDLANGRRPTDHSLVNEGNLYLWENKTFEAIDKYQTGMSRVTATGIMQNNLGMALTRIGDIDTASYFLNEARKSDISRESAETNFLGMAARENLPVDADSVVQLFNASSPGIVANALAISISQRQPFDLKIDPLKDKKLNLHTATLLNNYIMHNAKTLDSSFTARADRIISDPANADFNETLKSSLAFAFYHQGNIKKALSILAELAFISAESQGKYNYIQGLWALEQGSPEIASSYFVYAIEANYMKAKLYNAISLTEAGKLNEAIIAWDTVANDGDDAGKFIAGQIKQILTLPATAAMALTDEYKYQFCRYRVGVNDTTLFTRLSNSFTNPNYKAQALLDFSRRLFESGRTIPAIRYFNRISGLELSDKRLYEQARLFELEMLASRREVHQLIQQINKGITFDASHTLEKLLYAAMVSEMNGDLRKASENYAIVGTYNPYYEQGIMAAADFFRRQDEKSMKAYDMLAEAILVNSKSVKLLRAYAQEANRVGFDEYAASALQTVKELNEGN